MRSCERFSLRHKLALTRAQWLPKPATSLMPTKRRTLRVMWSPRRGRILASSERGSPFGELVSAATSAASPQLKAFASHIRGWRHCIVPGPSRTGLQERQNIWQFVCESPFGAFEPGRQNRTSRVCHNAASGDVRTPNCIVPDCRGGGRGRGICRHKSHFRGARGIVFEFWECGIHEVPGLGVGDKEVHLRTEPTRIIEAAGGDADDF